MSIDVNHGVAQFWIEPIKKCLPYSCASVSWILAGAQLKAVEIPERPERFARCQNADSAFREHGRQVEKGNTADGIPHNGRALPILQNGRVITGRDVIWGMA